MADEDLPTIQPNTLLPGGNAPTGLDAQGLAGLSPYTPAPALPTRPPDAWQTVARMLQGFASGAVGQQNPMIQLEQKQQALELQAQKQKIEMQQFDRLLQKDEAAVKKQQQQVAITTGLKLIDDPNPDNREWGYRMLQQHGALSPQADPAKMSVLSKVDYPTKRDEAISMIENGVDPEIFPEYKFLPLKQYKKMYADNPLSLNTLRASKLSEDALIKAFLMRARAMPPEQLAADPGMQRHIKAAESVLSASKLPDYGFQVNTALGQIKKPDGTGWNPKVEPIPPDVLREAGNRAQTDSGPPTADRDIERLADIERGLAAAQTPAEFKRLVADRDETIAKFRAKQSARMELQRLSRKDIEAGLEQQGFVRGTKEWDTAYLNAADARPLNQGGSLVGTGNIIAGLGPTGQGTGQQPTPPVALGPVPAVEGSTTKDIISAVRTRKSSQEVMSALQDPTVKSYIGNWAQHWSTIQRMTPKEMLGKIPPEVVRFEQNLATVKNYTIKLITGAQMGEKEADRIQGELPQQGNQVAEFGQRMEQTLENQMMMEKVIVNMALRGDQKAKALASDLGLLPGTPQVMPSSPSGAAAPEGTRHPERKRVRNTKNPSQTGTLAPGLPVPPGWELVP